nr:hypothetical protein Iba_chr02dCG3470 [Ipomoea batatas]
MLWGFKGNPINGGNRGISGNCLYAYVQRKMQHIYEGGNRVADAFENVGVKIPRSQLLIWKHTTLPSEPATRAKLLPPKRGKGKATDVVPSDPTLAARLPSVGVIIGASPTAIALAVAP